MNKNVLIALLLVCNSVFASSWHTHRADSHAPILIMGDHTHKKGETMISYRYMTMLMDGNQINRDSLTVDEVFNDYMVAPLDMRMSMHMLGAMYGYSDRLTLMAMIPYTIKSMNHRKKMDLSEFKRESSGIGDIKIGSLYELFNKEGRRLQLNTALSIPAGSIDEKGGTSSRLPYPMQLGSGTTDLQLGGTYMKQDDTWSFGSQLLGTFRFADNKLDYRLGNEYQFAWWIGKVISDSTSVSGTVRYRNWGAISGADSDLNPNMVPTAETNRAGRQLDFALGVHYLCQSKLLKGHRLALDIIIPIDDEFDSVQMQQEYSLIVGWQKVL